MLSRLQQLASEAKRALRRQSKREYAETLERQLERLKEAEGAALAEVVRWANKAPKDQRDAYKNAKLAANARAAAESFRARAARKARAVSRARSAAGLGLALGVFLHSGCASMPVQEALEVATVAASHALASCQVAHADTEGDVSRAAQDRRRACLGLPPLDASLDAAEALADELEAASLWVDTGSTRLLH